MAAAPPLPSATMPDADQAPQDWDLVSSPASPAVPAATIMAARPKESASYPAAALESAGEAATGEGSGNPHQVAATAAIAAMPSGAAFGAVSTSLVESPALYSLLARIPADLRALSQLYPIPSSPGHIVRQSFLLRSELLGLSQRLDFASLRTRQDQVAFLLLRSHMRRKWDGLKAQAVWAARTSPLVRPWSAFLTQLVEGARIRGVEMDAVAVAEKMKSFAGDVKLVRELVEGGKDLWSEWAGARGMGQAKEGGYEWGRALSDFEPGSEEDREWVALLGVAGKEVMTKPKDIDPPTAHRAMRMLDEYRTGLSAYAAMYEDYDPLFKWWVASGQGSGTGSTATASPLAELQAEVKKLKEAIRARYLTPKPKGAGKNSSSGSGNDSKLKSKGAPAPNRVSDITGEPIGRDALLAELEAEMIAYTPEELASIAEREYARYLCLIKQASADMGLGDDWKAAVESLKSHYAPPGGQIPLVRALVREGIEFTKAHNIATVPQLGEEVLACTMQMLSREAQRTAPYFLGGDSISVAAPTADMTLGEKLASLRANNKYFARATAFHEMVPGHGLQLWVADRAGRGYWTGRGQVGWTPFYVEGWATYCERVFWDAGFFAPETGHKPEDRVGTLFWQLHRCMRIVFSLGFHLGKLSALECVDLLVERVGHERNAAEAEVRRSLSGEYPPLYQCGYLVGALQLARLEREVCGEDAGGKKERLSKTEFRDQVLLEGSLPIEMLRALFGVGGELTEDWKPSWRFAD